MATISISETQGDDSRWAAVRRRDTSADGRFFYAVKTTRVYCRPGCSSRPPKRGNVEFFASAREAENAGYRPCKRCRPDGPPNRETQMELIESACRTIEQADDRVPLEQLAAGVGLSPAHLQRVFKQLVGLTPRQYAATHRTKRFRAGLMTEGSVTEAIYAAGYSSSSRAYESAAPTLGMSPSNFRNGAPGLAIHYAVTTCYLGSVLVAATDRGICAIELGGDADSLSTSLRRSFPKAEIRVADRDFSATVDSVVSLLENPARGLDLPLDIQGTAFQQRVWNALRKISPGETAHYAEIAQRIGRPTSARAVAAACASNRLAVAVPCHRVVPMDGDIGGYRWGADRKRKLLERERSSRQSNSGRES